MLQRTWEYGTTKEATVINVSGNAVVLSDEDGEAHVLIGVDHQITPQEGEGVCIEFCEGGPTGGYWKITKRIEPLLAT